MARPSKTAKLVITSIVITLIVLAAFTLVFINFIVPAYQITENQIYSVLTRLFPVLIGLILIQIGVMAAKRGEPEYKDTIDKLSPNAYDSSLYTEPKDDPMLRGKIDPAMFGNTPKANAEVKEVIKEVPVEVVKEVPVEIVREVEVPIERIREIQVPVEVIKEVPVEKIVEKEVIKEVPVEKIVEKEVLREVPVEVLKEVPVEIVKEVPVERIIEKEVPVEVVKEVPVEVIKEIPVEKEIAIEPEPEMLGFHEVLSEEIKAAADMDYDLWRGYSGIQRGWLLLCNSPTLLKGRSREGNRGTCSKECHNPQWSNSRCGFNNQRSIPLLIAIIHREPEQSGFFYRGM